MFREGLLDKTLRFFKRLIPVAVFRQGAKIYHPLLAWTGALRYGFPSRQVKVIGVTGTKGKSTTVYMITRILEEAGYPVAAVGSLGFKIKDREWPNELKMTMPGRWRLQAFLRRAANAGCAFVVMEVPSEGLAQGRHLGIRFDAAVFLNLHREHLEAHGGWEAYRAAKQLLFRACRGFHIVNHDDPSADLFLHFPARKRVTFGMEGGDLQATDVQSTETENVFQVGEHTVRLHMGGEFNVSNALAAITVADIYGVGIEKAAQALESINGVPGRMDWVLRRPFGVVVDYAHTPDSLEAVYRTLKPHARRLICVLGSAGGGRDAWKREEFGRIAEQYGDVIVLTNEDPYDEDPEKILDAIEAGISSEGKKRVRRILDRGQAIHEALTESEENDIVVITGKGSETAIALAGGKKMPWSDRAAVEALLKKRGM